MAAAVSLTASPALAATVTRSGGGPERGIDISAYQNANGPIDWRELASHGIKFVAIKASEDTYYTNPYYLPDARAASRAGLAVLAYAFANPGPGGRRGHRQLRRPGRALPARPRHAPAGRRSGERPVLDQRLLLVRPGPDDRLDRRVRQPGQGADRVVADHLHHRLLVAGVHRVDRPVQRATRSGWPITTAGGRPPLPRGPGGRSGSTARAATCPGSAGPTSTFSSRPAASRHSARPRNRSPATATSAGPSTSRSTRRPKAKKPKAKAPKRKHKAKPEEAVQAHRKGQTFTGYKSSISTHPHQTH